MNFTEAILEGKRLDRAITRQEWEDRAYIQYGADNLFYVTDIKSPFPKKISDLGLLIDDLTTGNYVLVCKYCFELPRKEPAQKRKTRLESAELVCNELKKYLSQKLDHHPMDLTGEDGSQDFKPTMKALQQWVCSRAFSKDD